MCVDVRVFACVPVCVSTCKCAHVYVCVSEYVCVGGRVSLCVCARECHLRVIVHTCVYTRVYVHACV